MTTDEMLNIGWADLVIHCQKVQKQRDELLAAAERVLRTKRGDDDWLILAIDCIALEEAIAKVKAGAA